MVRIRMKDIDPVLSEEELAELERAEKLPPCYDEDCPEMTEEMLQQFRRVKNGRRQILPDSKNDCISAIS